MKMFKPFVSIILIIPLILAEKGEVQEPVTRDSMDSSVKVVPPNAYLGIRPEAKYPRLFYIEPDRSSVPTLPGQFSFRFMFIQNLNCEEVQMSIKRIHKLEFFGAASWTFSTKLGDTSYQELDIRIPNEGISGLTIEAFSCDIRDSIHVYFISQDDTVRFSRMNLSRAARSRPPQERTRNSDSNMIPNQEMKQGRSYVSFGVSAAQEKKRVDSETIEKLTRDAYDRNRRPPSGIWPYFFKIEMEPQVLSPGPATVKILFSPNTKCKDARVSILDIEKLEYVGEKVWNISPSIGDTQIFIMNLNIPANDTSGFKFEIENCGSKQQGFHYFIAGDSIIYTSPMNLSRAARIRPPRHRPAKQY